MAFFTKEELRATKKKPPRRVVTIPELGDVIIQGMTARQWGEIQAAQMKNTRNGPKLDLRLGNARVVAYCLVNENGDRWFGDDEIGDLASLPNLVLDPMYEAACELSAISKKQEEITGELKDDPNSCSPTTSHLNGVGAT